jgi:hypothetical protein
MQPTFGRSGCAHSKKRETGLDSPWLWVLPQHVQAEGESDPEQPREGSAEGSEISQTAPFDRISCALFCFFL